ncbi:MAG: hypothetical protein EOO73_31450 [Myxococcales bacterium]|nr:MAG: hypothetical protein EOO73_31450 [Myxococcales bacterium]
MALGDDGGGAVAQRRLDAACVVAMGLGALGLALWAYREVTAATGGPLGAPLDDSYIHFQFARSFARFRPFEYVAGAPRVAGATSLLWPALLTPAIWLGASAQGLIALTWVLGFGALFGQAAEVFLSGRRFLSRPAACAGGLVVLTFSANTWFAASAMEVVPLGWLLLRSARRAAEYVEVPRCVWRERELVALALLTSLMRPEGALAALCIGAALAWRRRALLALMTLAAPLTVPIVNWLLTGHATQTTTLAKWLVTNPYYEGRVWSSVLANVELLFGTLWDGRQWSWTFIPEGYKLLGLLSLPALAAVAWLRGAKVLGAFLCVVGLGILIPTSYETFLVNRLRYLWPFSAPWLLGLAALGELLALPLATKRRELLWLGLALPAAAGGAFAKLSPVSVSDVAQSAAAITAQQVSLGRWAAANLPRDARIGVNDAGAISYFSERRTFDIVGLTTLGEARFWVGGAGSRFEHYERMPRAELPTHFFVYPEWFGVPSLLGECLTERRVEGATILGGPLMVACRADYASLGSGAKPLVDLRGRPALDELDVADLESEAGHGYVLGAATAQENLVEGWQGRFDGGRGRRYHERFRLRVQPGGLLVVRLSAQLPGELRLFVAGAQVGGARFESGQFQELQIPIAESAAAGLQAVELHGSQLLTVLHYWSYGRVL